MCVCICVWVCGCALGGQKWVLDPPELALQAVGSREMWVLGSKLRSSSRASSASPSPIFPFTNVLIGPER